MVDLLRTLIVIAALILLAPLATAKGGPPLSVEENTLWNQYTTEGGCCTSWASTLKDDPAFQGSGNLGTSGTTPDGSFSWVMPLEPPLDRVVELDPEGLLEATVNIGSTYGTTPHVGSGQVTVTTQLLLGDQTVAQGSGEEITYLTAQGYEEVSWSMSPQITTLDPALGNLEWRVTISGTYSGAYMSHTDANGNGWISLPIASVIEPPLDALDVFENVTGLPLTIEQSFANATTGNHTYNWTHDGGDLDIRIGGEVRNGTLGLLLLDAAGEEVVSGDLATLLEANQTLRVPAPNGTWQVVLSMHDFVGSVRLDVQAAQAETPPEEPTPGPDSNQTLDVSDVDKDSPSVALPLVGFMLLLALRRRGA